MNLNELIEKYNELNRKVEQKRRNLVRFQDMLFRTSNEIQDLGKELETISFLMDSLSVDEVTIYGVFNTKEIGNVLAKLATIITGVKYKFAVIKDSEQGFACIHNHAVYFDREIATLIKEDEKEITPSWKFCFASSNEPTEKDKISYWSENGGGYGRCDIRTMEEYKKLTEFDENTKSFKYENMHGKETVDFISDYLVFIANYRLEHGLVDISENELTELMNIFLENYKDKYSNYKEEKRALEESIDYAHERNELIKKRIHQSYSMKRSYRKFGRK